MNWINNLYEFVVQESFLTRLLVGPPQNFPAVIPCEEFCQGFAKIANLELS